MPIYSYKCLSVIKADNSNDPYTGGHDLKCLHEYDVLYQNHEAVDREEPSERCPECGSTEKERLISRGTSHILKGRGWYKDGY